MGQQPNIELDIDALPRGAHEPGAPSGWKPTRPGEILSPAAMPVGGVFGNPSPDGGWIVKLVREAEYKRAGRALDDVVVAVASARASVFGRGPVPDDVEAALVVLGLREDGLPPELLERVRERRTSWLAKTAHEPVRGRAALDAIGREFLHQSVDDIRAGLPELLS